MGRNYMSLLSMTRSAGAAGYPVYVVKTVKKIPGKYSPYRWSVDAHSKYVKDCFYVKQNDDKGLIDLLVDRFRSYDGKIVLLPTDDRTVAAIEFYKERLDDRFLFPYASGEQSVLELMDKKAQKAFATVAGLPVAQGWTTEVKNGTFEIPEGILYPVFTKPQISFAGNKRFMKRCNNEAELREVLQQIAEQRDCPMLIEQFVEIEKEYGVLAYCNPEEPVVPCLVDKVEIGQGTHKGVTMIGRVLPLETENRELQEKLKAFLKSTGFVGLVDIDLYESKGVIYFNELNLRFGAFGYAAMCAGINMPQMLIGRLLGRKLTDPKTCMDRPITCLSEKVNLEDYADGYCSISVYRQRMTQAEYAFIRSEDDMRPYRYFKFEEVKQTLKRMLRKGRK